MKRLKFVSQILEKIQKTHKQDKVDNNIKKKNNNNE